MEAECHTTADLNPLSYLFLVLSEKTTQTAAKDISAFLELLMDVTDTAADMQGHSWQ